jgi:thioesterase domain-containing protein/acyl carrier protein
MAVDTEVPKALAEQRRRHLHNAIRSDEGVQAFDRLLRCRLRQVAVSPRMMPSLGATVQMAQEEADMKSTSATEASHARPRALVQPYVAPRNEREERIAGVWQELFGIDRVGVHDGFFDLGGHSLLAVRLFAQIRKAYNLSFSLAVLYEAGTIAQLADMIIGEVGLTPDKASSSGGRAVKKGWSSLVTINKGNPDRPKFFCVHDLNGHVLYYRDLAKALGSDQPFYALQARGQDGKEDLDTSIDMMATRYLKDIRAEQPSGPYYLGGSSLGGMVAFEIAQQLIADGERVSLLALFDSWTPDYRSQVVSWEERTLSQKIAHHLDQIKTQGAAYFADRARSRVEWMKYKVEATRLRGVRLVKNVWLKTGRTLPDFLLTFHREETYGNMYNTYQPQAYAAKITLFRATERSAKDQFDPTLGWHDLALGDVEVIESPGEHGWMVRDPHAAVLAASLRDCIDRAAGITQRVEQGR